MLTAPRPDYLATAEERIAGERIALIEKQLGDSDSPESVALRQRAARLRGALTWRLETEYHERLTAAHVHLNELNTQVDALTSQYDAFVRTRQAATHSYVGYDVQIARLRERVGEAQQRVEMLMARQGHMIETVAINQLEARRERLVAQQTEARFGVADSYDRASRAQSGGSGPVTAHQARRFADASPDHSDCARAASDGRLRRACQQQGSGDPVGTLAELRNVQPDVQDVKVEQGLEQAMLNYRRFLEETPETAMTPEAMRRLADLQLEKQFGIRTGDTKPREMAAPQPAQALAGAQPDKANSAAPAAAGLRESDQDFERRTTAEGGTS